MDFPEDINSLGCSAFDTVVSRHVEAQCFTTCTTPSGCQSGQSDLPQCKPSHQDSLRIFHEAVHGIEGEVPLEDDDEDDEVTALDDYSGLVNDEHSGASQDGGDQSMPPQLNDEVVQRDSSSTVKSHPSFSSTSSSYVSLRDLGVEPPRDRSLKGLFEEMKIMFLETWTFATGCARAASKQREAEWTFEVGYARAASRQHEAELYKHEQHLSLSQFCSEDECRCTDPDGCNARAERLGIQGCSC